MTQELKPRRLSFKNRGDFPPELKLHLIDTASRAQASQTKISLKSSSSKINKNSLPTSCDQAINKFSKQPASVVGDVLVESGFEVVPVVDEVDPEVVGTAVDPVLH